MTYRFSLLNHLISWKDTDQNKVNLHRHTCFLEHLKRINYLSFFKEKNKWRYHFSCFQLKSAKNYAIFSWNQLSFENILLKNPPFCCFNYSTCPHSVMPPFSITTTLSNKAMLSRRWVITINVLFYANLNICSCNRASVFGSMLEDTSSKQTISVSRRITLKKFTIYFSPFDRFDPPSSILKSKSS